MQSGAPIKTRSTLTALAGLIFASMLSACGGGSDGGPGKGEFDAVVPREGFNQYIGTYSDNDCWSDSATSDRYSGITNHYVISESTTPNTLNITVTHYYYQYDRTAGNRCGVKVGASTAYGEMTYIGTQPSVEFSYSTKSPLAAGKFQAQFSEVINWGTVGDRFDDLSDFNDGDGKFLWASDGNVVYFGDFDFPLDEDGFPTKLYDFDLLVRRTQDAPENQLSDYIGTYLDPECMLPSPFFSLTNSIALSPSEKPNTLNIVNTHTYYQYDKNSVRPLCGKPIGSSTAYGEMTYVGTEPSVAFSDGIEPNLPADKFQVTYTNVVNQGEVRDDWDDVSDFDQFSHLLLTKDVNVVYLGNMASPLDAQGFPTKLNQFDFFILQ